MSLSVEQILSANDKAVQKVSCPEWGGDVYVRTLSADERDKWEMAQAEDRSSVRASLVGVALCDESGKSLGLTPAQIKGLGQKASGPMDRIFDAVLSLNKMRASDVEKLEGNLEPTDEPG